jgi:hypothetical protein
MGCSASSTLEDKNVQQQNFKRSVLLENAERVFKTNHEKFELLMLDSKIREDFDHKSNSNINQFLDTFHFKWKANFDSVRLSKEEISMIVFEKMSESLIIDHLRFKDWDVVDVISHVIEHFDNLKDKSYEIIEDLLLTSSRYFPSNQKGCIFPDTNGELTKMKGYKALYNTLKFNMNFQMQMFTLFLCPSLFISIENVSDMCDIIISNKGLQTLLLVFNHYNDGGIQQFPDMRHLSSISNLLDTVRVHNAISTLVFGCCESYIFNLPVETVHSLTDLVRADKLITLCITKISLKNEELDILFEVLGGLSNLKFLVLDVVFEPQFEEKFVNMVRRNKKLLGVFLAGCHVANPVSLEEKIFRENCNLKVFHYEPKVNFFI